MGAGAGAETVTGAGAGAASFLLQRRVGNFKSIKVKAYNKLAHEPAAAAGALAGWVALLSATGVAWGADALGACVTGAGAGAGALTTRVFCSGAATGVAAGAASSVCASPFQNVVFLAPKLPF